MKNKEFENHSVPPFLPEHYKLLDTKSTFNVCARLDEEAKYICEKYHEETSFDEPIKAIVRHVAEHPYRFEDFYTGYSWFPEKRKCEELSQPVSIPEKSYPIWLRFATANELHDAFAAIIPRDIIALTGWNEINVYVQMAFVKKITPNVEAYVEDGRLEKCADVPEFGPKPHFMWSLFDGAEFFISIIGHEFLHAFQSYTKSGEADHVMSPTNQVATLNSNDFPQNAWNGMASDGKVLENAKIFLHYISPAEQQAHLSGLSKYLRSMSKEKMLNRIAELPETKGILIRNGYDVAKAVAVMSDKTTGMIAAADMLRQLRLCLKIKDYKMPALLSYILGKRKLRKSAMTDDFMANQYKFLPDDLELNPNLVDDCKKTVDFLSDMLAKYKMSVEKIAYRWAEENGLIKTLTK